MKNALEFAALILGLAISLHTVFSVGHSFVERRRELRALIAELRFHFNMMLRLVPILAGKATRFQKKYSEVIAQMKLPDEAWAELEVLKTRAKQIIALAPDLEPSKWGAKLNRRQLRFFMAFLDDYQLYQDRLALRFEEFNAAPGRPGALARFLACAALDDVNLPGRFRDFEQSMGWAVLNSVDQDKGSALASEE